jgi:pimeloyl-ACP methyl ester carboxylesterase
MTDVRPLRASLHLRSTRSTRASPQARHNRLRRPSLCRRAGPKPRPLLIVSADNDHTVPWSIAKAAFKKQRRNDGVTEIVKVPDRGHSLTIDSRRREVADKALAVVKRFV